MPTPHPMGGTGAVEGAGLPPLEKVRQTCQTGGDPHRHCPAGRQADCPGLATRNQTQHPHAGQPCHWWQHCQTHWEQGAGLVRRTLTVRWERWAPPSPPASSPPGGAAAAARQTPATSLRPAPAATARCPHHHRLGPHHHPAIQQGRPAQQPANGPPGLHSVVALQQAALQTQTPYCAWLRQGGTHPWHAAAPTPPPHAPAQHNPVTPSTAQHNHCQSPRKQQQNHWTPHATCVVTPQQPFMREAIPGP